ncbi:hypothetical protein FA15DRAFT_699801 [Coprinopsis marcescibilis]|uniref:Uncharacterized protein n=1 Tax=Coprinopsis marcescibilis TaxID=230819 RepID=A0A5C3LNH6_COPMA|nr:hypothetical protein FA15DRAFT_699801 [Coprinopsis marcescibilis]
MPSLRRIASSPSVRSSPYSSSFTGAHVARGHGHRRSSGSDIMNRRVLADIEWWRVTDGQCEPSAGDLESEEPNHGVVQHSAVIGGIAGGALFNADIGVDHPTYSEHWATADMISTTAEFAALSIAPQTPLQRRARDELESSSSSLESTPEAPTPLSFEGLRLGLSDMNMDFGRLFEDRDPLMPLLGFDTLILPPPGLARAHTFADCLSLQDDFANCYPISPMPQLLSLPTFIN